MDEPTGQKARALRGVLWGTALGDALGFPYEGLSALAIARRGFSLERLGQGSSTRAFVSDDTEQSALLLESLIRGRGNLDLTIQSFRQALRAWFLRLPFGIGRSSLRACLRILAGRPDTGVHSLGAGAAMRAAVVGAFFADDPAERRRHASALAGVTHCDPGAVEGAMFTAELAALCVREPQACRTELALRALAVVEDAALYEALEGAVLLARSRYAERPPHDPSNVVDTLSLCTWAFVRAGDSPLQAIQLVIRAGGSTDTAGAIVGGWLGALRGPDALPASLLARVHDGPFGPAHLAQLADAVEHGQLPRWSPKHAMLRNLRLIPVALSHLLRRVIPRLTA
jgi:ADP-ribosyl-[dinitrogen reductase] hydrolase